MSGAVLPPLALYVHVPWCVRKCPYCDFNSHAAGAPPPWPAYVDALLTDLSMESETVRGRALGSIFIGGGTPSLMPAGAVGRLLDGVAAVLDLAPECEVTLEANPGTAEAARFRDYRSAGVTRLSIGVQSLDDRLLAAIGRIHDAGEARRAVAHAHAAGFACLNLDLMFGLPGQTLGGALHELHEALALGTGHLSHYQLTVEPNTAFHHRPPAGLPDEDALAEMQDACAAVLCEAGHRRYEVSAWARPGECCRHNLNYWRFGDYLGIGAGAHAKLTRAPGVVERTVRERHPRRYLEAAATGAFVVSRRRLTRDDLPFEFMLNALRLAGGFDRGLFERRTGLPIDEVAGTLEQARARGLVALEESHVQPTALGMAFHNDLVALFLPAGDAARGAGERLPASPVLYS